MASVVSITLMRGSAGPVFDLVTSARFWPRWHPATLSVSGVTERPYLLGDLIHEHVRFAGTELDVTWRIAEHRRPARVVLQALNSAARITYSFEAMEDATAFRRQLEYDDDLLRQALRGVENPGAFMQAQSEEGMRRLKALVEEILGSERAAAADPVRS